MNTGWAKPFGESKSFRVVRSTPVYDASTDAYRGQKHTVEAFCSTLEAAVRVLGENYGESAYDPEVGWEIVHPSGYYMVGNDFEVNSYYDGPTCYNEDYPF